MDEVLRELTARSNDEQMTSEGVLAWAKRVQMQRAQAAILNDITELCQFDKITMAQKSKSSQDRQVKNTTSHRQPCRYCGGIHMPQQCPAYGKMCARCRKMGHYKKVCRSKRDRAVHELQVKMV